MGNEVSGPVSAAETAAENPASTPAATLSAGPAPGTTPAQAQPVAAQEGNGAAELRRRSSASAAPRPSALVIVGPSGVGKNTLIKQLMEGNNQFGFSISHTTRQPRQGEKHGREYYFVSKELFTRDIAEGRFLEHAEVHGRLYGTSAAAVQAVLDEGRVCVLDVDVQGARQLRRSGLRAIFVFVAPPSLEDLARRLAGRGTETAEQIRIRMENAKAEIHSLNEKGLYDYLVINDDLDEAVGKLRQIAARAAGGMDPEPGQVPETVIIEEAPLPDLTELIREQQALSPPRTSDHAAGQQQQQQLAQQQHHQQQEEVVDGTAAAELLHTLPGGSHPADGQRVEAAAPEIQAPEVSDPVPSPSSYAQQQQQEQQQEQAPVPAPVQASASTSAAAEPAPAPAAIPPIASAAPAPAPAAAAVSFPPPVIASGSLGGAAPLSDVGMERWAGKVALVTGASSGIGAAVCEALAAMGMRVVAVARRKDRLEQLQQRMHKELQVPINCFLPVVCDITKDAEVATLPRIVSKRWPDHGVDVLVNNAGMSRNDASMFEGNVASWVEMLSTNVLGNAMCTRAVLQDMVRRGAYGHIVNMVGLSGHRIPDGPQGGGFYCGTKAAVKMMTEGLRQEARGRGVPLRVSAISPGMVETEFFAVRSFGDQSAAAAATSQFKCLEPKDIAQAIVWCLSAPDHVEVNDVVVRPSAQML